MSPTDQPDDIHAQAGEYVLGTLSIDEREALEERLVHDRELQMAVAAWEERFFPYTALVEPLAPSDYLWPRIQRSLKVHGGGISPATATTGSKRAAARRRLVHSLPFWRGAAGLGMAAALIMGIMLANVVDEPVTPEYMVVLVAPQTQSAGWVVQAVNREEIQLLPLGTFEVPAGKALEFWTKADDWQEPVSLGLVEPGQPLRLRLDQLPPLQDNQLFELTLEDESGSPTGLPTGPIEFIGRAVEI